LLLVAWSFLFFIFIVVVFIRAIAPMRGNVSRAFVFAMRTELNASVEK
jgi:hypothetical protein